MKIAGGDWAKYQRLVDYIAKQQDVVTSLQAHKDDVQKVTTIITTQMNNCFNKSPTKTARAKAKAFNTDTPGKGKGNGKSTDGKGNATGKGKPQRLAGTQFVAAKNLDANLLTFENDEGEPAHRIVPGEVLGREPGYDLVTQE